MRMHDLEVMFNSNKGKKGFIPSLQILESREVPAGNLVGSFSMDNSWGSGMQGLITIKNTGGVAVTNWAATFNYANTISSSWNGSVTQTSPGNYKITNAGYNSTINPGQAITVGFIGGSNYAQNPSNFAFTGGGLSSVIAPTPTPTPTPAPTPAPGVSATLSYKVTSDWGSGFNADITIKNTGTTTLKSWTSSFDVPWTVDTIWSASIVSHTGTKYTIQAADWNKDIAPGASITFGFSGHGTSSVSPTNVVINGSGSVVAPTPTPTPIVTPTLVVNDSAVTVTGVLDNTASNGFLSTSGNQIVDANGNTVRISGINWFGFETSNKVFHGLWTRSYTSVLDQVKTLGFNTLRVPFSNEMLRSDAVTSSINFAQNPDLQGLTPIQCLDKMVEYCGKIGLRVILDRHSAKADGYLNEDVWYIPNDSYYTEQRWISDWSMLAKRYANNPTVIGADLFNEPKKSATWGDSSPATDWNKAAERCGNAILAANPNWLVIVEGVEKYNNETTWWGGNLKGAAFFPVNLSMPNKLVYSAHEYPSSVYAQKWFSDPAYPNNMDEVWNTHFGYLFQNQTAPIFIGEFGSKLGSASDQIWLDKFTDYMDGDLNLDGTKDLVGNQKGMSWTYWSLNPNSGDTGGILNDDWTTVNTSKMAYIQSSLAPMLGTATGNSQTMNFQVKLSAATSGTVTVKYATANGTAIAGTNYQATSGTLTFAPGETTKTVSIVIPSQNLTTSKSFTLQLSAPTGATLADASGVGTIQLANSPTPTPTPVNSAPVAIADSVWIPSASPSSFAVLANDSDPNGDKISVKSVTQGSFGSVSINPDGSVLYTPGMAFMGADSFNYTVTDVAGLTATASVSVNLVAEGTKAWPANVFAPYVDTTLWPVLDFTKIAREQGLRYFSLGFITATSAGKPAWGGFTTYEIDGQAFDMQMRAKVNDLRSLGGDVNVSFGGAANQEMAEVISDKVALKAAYQQVINAYGLTRIDFDLEGAALAHKAVIDRRSLVLAELQADALKAGKPLEIWLTLPVLPTGLTLDGIYAIQSAFKAGVKLGGVNIMAMDYGDSSAPNPNGKMGDYSIQAAISLHAQLKTITTGFSDAKLWSMVGITPMIGRNDVLTEVFDQQEAREVLAFAQEKNLGLLSFWSLNRDLQNPNGALSRTDNTSSSILQTPYEFSGIFKVFTSPVTTATVSASTSPAATADYLFALDPDGTLLKSGSMVV